jgi:hypothetical protein
LLLVKAEFNEVYAIPTPTIGRPPKVPHIVVVTLIHTRSQPTPVD